MKDIVKKAGTQAKLRLRGKGSGFVEHNSNKESEEALQLCISCTDAFGYDTSIQCVDALLRRIYFDYDKWCYDKGLPNRAPAVHLRERRAPDRSRGYGGFPALTGGPAPSQKKRREPKGFAEGEDKGEQPPGAPDAEEIERLIEERNEARKNSDYKRADEIRDDLHKRRVVLMDNKGAAGNHNAVTNWRYWKEEK